MEALYDSTTLIDHDIDLKHSHNFKVARFLPLRLAMCSMLPLRRVEAHYASYYSIRVEHHHLRTPATYSRASHPQTILTACPPCKSPYSLSHRFSNLNTVLYHTLRSPQRNMPPRKSDASKAGGVDESTPSKEKEGLNIEASVR